MKLLLVVPSGDSLRSLHYARSGPNFLRKFGGDGEIRTPDLMLAKHALYQLSYTPEFTK